MKKHLENSRFRGEILAVGSDEGEGFVLNIEPVNFACYTMDIEGIVTHSFHIAVFKGE